MQAIPNRPTFMGLQGSGPVIKIPLKLLKLIHLNIATESI